MAFMAGSLFDLSPSRAHKISWHKDTATYQHLATGLLSLVHMIPFLLDTLRLQALRNKGEADLDCFGDGRRPRERG